MGVFQVVKSLFSTRAAVIVCCAASASWFSGAALAPDRMRLLEGLAQRKLPFSAWVGVFILLFAGGAIAVTFNDYSQDHIEKPADFVRDQIFDTLFLLPPVVLITMLTTIGVKSGFAFVAYPLVFACVGLLVAAADYMRSLITGARQLHAIQVRHNAASVVMQGR